MLAALGAWASPASAQAGYDPSALAAHIGCMDAGGSPRECAVESGFMDADTFDRKMLMVACIERGGERAACRVESGLASEETIAREEAAQQDLAAYLTRLMHRVSNSPDPVQRLAALELAASLRAQAGVTPALVDPDAVRGWMATLARGLEAGLGHDPDLLAGLLRACQGHPCGGRALLERLEDLEPGNLHWLDRTAHPMSEDTATWLAAAAESDRFNERQWDAVRRITQLLEAHPLPESLLPDSGAGTDLPPDLLAFGTAFALAGEHNVVRMGGGPLQLACREPSEDVRAHCFRIGEVKLAHGGTLNRRDVGAEMMQVAAWDEATRERARLARDAVAWQREKQHEAVAMVDTEAAAEELAFMRDVVMREGATEIDLLHAYLELAGIPPAPPPEGLR